MEMEPKSAESNDRDKMNLDAARLQKKKKKKRGDAYGYNDQEQKVESEMCEILRYDDSKEFIELVNSSEYCKRDTYRLMWNLFYYDAPKCVKAILEGETCGKYDIHAFLSHFGTTPLHAAAFHGAYGLTELFLDDYGHDPNLLGDCVFFESKDCLRQMLPFNVALSSTWLIGFSGWDYPIQWESSAFRLVSRLCSHEMRRSLATLRLLAQETRNLDQQISYYLKGGRVDEICALMLIGCLSPSEAATYGEEGNELTNQLVVPDFMIKQFDKVFGNRFWTKEFRQIKGKELVMQLVEIFERIGHQLQAYIVDWSYDVVGLGFGCVAPEVASLFEDAGLSLRRKPETPMLYSPFSSQKQNGSIISNSVSRKSVDSESASLFEDAEVLVKRKPETPMYSPCNSEEENGTIISNVVKIPEKLKYAISKDWCMRFLSELKSLLEGEEADNSLLMLEMLKLMCLHRAENCAAFLIRENYNISLDLDVAVEDGLSILQIAARTLSYYLTEVVLHYGAQSNLSSFDAHAKLALELALEALSSKPDLNEWSPEKSLYKLFSIFSLSKLANPLSTIKLLASRTEQVEKICIQCVKKGEVVKFAALILGTWNKMMGPLSTSGANKSIEDSSIAKFIWKEIRSLSDETNMKNKSTSSSCDDSHLSDRKNKLESAWLVLKICEASLESIKDPCYSSFYEVFRPHDISARVVHWLSYVESLGNLLAVRPEDVPRLVPRLKPKDKERLNRTLKLQMEQGSFTRFSSEKHDTHTNIGLRSFHTSTMTPNSFTKDAKFRSISTVVPKPPFLEFLPICARVLRSATRFK